MDIYDDTLFSRRYSRREVRLIPFCLILITGYLLSRILPALIQSSETHMPYQPPPRPAGNYEPHPVGVFHGTITEIKDYGVMESLYKDPQTGNTREVHRIAIVITADPSDAVMESGAPWQHYEFCNISFAPRARLTELRNLLRDADMTRDELEETFDETVEMVGRRIRYRIRHEKNEQTDKIRATIRDWEYAEGEAPDLKNGTGQPVAATDATEAVKRAFDAVEPDDDLPF